MQTTETQFEAELAKVVNARIEQFVAELSNTMAVPNIEHYRYRAGVVDGLRLINELCQEANQNIEERQGA